MECFSLVPILHGGNSVFYAHLGVFIFSELRFFSLIAAFHYFNFNSYIFRELKHPTIFIVDIIIL